MIATRGAPRLPLKKWSTESTTPVLRLPCLLLQSRKESALGRSDGCPPRVCPGGLCSSLVNGRETADTSGKYISDLGWTPCPPANPAHWAACSYSSDFSRPWCPRWKGASASAGQPRSELHMHTLLPCPFLSHPSPLTTTLLLCFSEFPVFRSHL